VVWRNALASETRIVGHAEFGLYAGTALWAVQSWGEALPLLAGTGVSNAPFSFPLLVNLLGRFSSTTTDTFTLRNYTVIRYPAHSTP
jgi:hypothetical protein